MPHNIVLENEKYKKLNRNTFASYGSYEMVQAKLETHYTQKKLSYIKFARGKDGANKCKLRGIPQVDWPGSGLHHLWF